MDGMARAAGQWTGDDESKPAPAPLNRVQSLVNTIDREIGQDRLADLADAVPWLVAKGLLPENISLSRDELAFVRDVREALRSLVRHSTDGTAVDPAGLAVLRDVAAAGTVRADVADDGSVTWRPDADSLRARLAGLLLVVADAQRDGTWQRLKTCGNEECLWVFYDQSRNRGGSWCTMATCGNKLKNRDFRARHRQSR